MTETEWAHVIHAARHGVTCRGGPVDTDAAIARAVRSLVTPGAVRDLLGDEEYMDASLSHRPLSVQERADAIGHLTEREAS